jgi:hypothetical protein
VCRYIFTQDGRTGCIHSKLLQTCSEVVIHVMIGNMFMDNQMKVTTHIQAGMHDFSADDRHTLELLLVLENSTKQLSQDIMPTSMHSKSTLK